MCALIVSIPAARVLVPFWPQNRPSAYCVPSKAGRPGQHRRAAARKARVCSALTRGKKTARTSPRPARRRAPSAAAARGLRCTRTPGERSPRSILFGAAADTADTAGAADMAGTNRGTRASSKAHVKNTPGAGDGREVVFLMLHEQDERKAEEILVSRTVLLCVLSGPARSDLKRCLPPVATAGLDGRGARTGVVVNRHRSLVG